MISPTRSCLVMPSSRLTITCVLLLVHQPHWMWKRYNIWRITANNSWSTRKIHSWILGFEIWSTCSVLIVKNTWATCLHCRWRNTREVGSLSMRRLSMLVMLSTGWNVMDHATDGFTSIVSWLQTKNSTLWQREKNGFVICLTVNNLIRMKVYISTKLLT